MVLGKLAAAIGLAIEPEFLSARNGELEALALLEVLGKKGRAALLRNLAPHGKHHLARLVRRDGKRSGERVEPVRGRPFRRLAEIVAEAPRAPLALLRRVLEALCDLLEPVGVVVGKRRERNAVVSGEPFGLRAPMLEFLGSVDVGVGEKHRHFPPRVLQPRHARARARPAADMEHRLLSTRLIFLSHHSHADIISQRIYHSTSPLPQQWIIYRP